MIVQQTFSFKSKTKKLHNNQLKELEVAIKVICESPTICTKKEAIFLKFMSISLK